MRCSLSIRAVEVRVAARAWLLWALLCAQAWALEPSEVFKQTRAGIVAVSALDAKQGKRLQGSGVLLGATEVVTNCHLVYQRAQIEVQQGVEKRAATVRFRDLERNLCQLTFASSLPGGKPIAAFAPTVQAEVGQPVFAVSMPYGEEPTFVRGMLAGLRPRPGDKASLILTDVPVSEASSGGGLFDGQARLIGIVTAGLADGQNLNMALPSEWVQQLATRNLDRVEAGVQDNTPPAAEAATPPPAAQPWRPLVGERWVYRLRGGDRDLGKVTVEVTRSVPGRVRERLTREGFNSFRAEREVDVVFDPSRFSPSVSLPGGHQMVELSPYLPPGEELHPGKSWRDVGTEISFNTIGRRNTVFEVRTVGKEVVFVPAGRFDAWKIETVSKPLDNYTKVQCTYWYASGMRRVVKTRVKVDSGYISLRTDETYELVSAPAGDGEKTP